MRSASLTSLLITFSLVSLPALAAQSPSGDKDPALAGAILFHNTGCEHCHGVGGVGTKKGPPLVEIRDDKKWPPEKMRDQILNGGEKMPPFGDSLTDDEISQVIAYLRAKDRPSPPSTPASSTAQ
jgi:mono/diheme cytochrome c family protein